MTYILHKLNIGCRKIEESATPEPETERGIKAVDLGLPSGRKWANINVGADLDTDYGLYFHWGGTVGYTLEEAKSRNDWPYSPVNGGNSTKNKKAICLWREQHTEKVCATQTTASTGKRHIEYLLESDCDAATAYYGNSWRMPTYLEIEELLQNTDYSCAMYNGVPCSIFTNKSDSSKFIRIPLSLMEVGAEGLVRRQSLWGASACELNLTYEWYSTAAALLVDYSATAQTQGPYVSTAEMYLLHNVRPVYVEDASLEVVEDYWVAPYGSASKWIEEKSNTALTNLSGYEAVLLDTEEACSDGTTIEFSTLAIKNIHYYLCTNPYYSGGNSSTDKPACPMSGKGTGLYAYLYACPTNDYTEFCSLYKANSSSCKALKSWKIGDIYDNSIDLLATETNDEVFSTKVEENIDGNYLWLVVLAPSIKLETLSGETGDFYCTRVSFDAQWAAKAIKRTIKE